MWHWMQQRKATSQRNPGLVTNLCRPVAVHADLASPAPCIRDASCVEPHAREPLSELSNVPTKTPQQASHRSELYSAAIHLACYGMVVACSALFSTNQIWGTDPDPHPKLTALNRLQDVTELKTSRIWTERCTRNFVTYPSSLVTCKASNERVGKQAFCFEGSHMSHDASSIQLQWQLM